ncbi:MAG: SPFH domain-containing protein [Myxococcota bacterium]
MGLWDRLRQHAGAQLLEVIDWTDDSRDTLVYRYPTFNQAITDKSKLVVREGQVCVFVAEGQLSEVFGPGTYSLDTNNAPIMRFFQSIVYKLEEPYKGDIYFMNTRQFMDNGWGTSSPIMLRDAEFGPVRLRGHGIFSYRITEPATFLRQVVGTDGLFTTDEINGQLKRKLQGSLAQVIGQSQIAILDLAANYQNLGDQLRDNMNPSFVESYGITLTDFTIQNISLPAEVEKALDSRSKMGILGDMGTYTQMKAADAIETAAANPGVGGIGASMGVGFGLGNQIGQNMAQAQGGTMGGAPAAPPQAPPPPAPVAEFHYAGASGQSGPHPIDEIVRRVVAEPNGRHMVWQSGFPSWKSAQEVPEIAAQLPAVPPPAPGSAVYHYAGPSGQSEKTVAEIAAEIRSAPDGKHHVWQKGWAMWKPAMDVEEIREEVEGDGPPPPPPI